MCSVNPCGFDFVLKITTGAFAVAECWDYSCFYAFSRATFVSALCFMSSFFNYGCSFGKYKMVNSRNKLRNKITVVIYFPNYILLRL